MTRIIHYLRAINAENIKEWRIELKYKPDFVRQFFEPFIYLLPYFLYGVALLGGRFSEHLRSLTGVGDMIAYTFIGYLIMGFLNTACWAMGASLRKEQWYGTLDTIFVAPVPRWVYVAGMAAHSTCHQGLIMFIQAIVITAFFAIAFKTASIFMVLIIVALMLLALYGLGVLVAGLTIGLKQWWVVSETLSTMITVVTPIAYPLAVLPIFIRKISLLLPTTYGVMGVRHLLLGEHLALDLGTIVVRLAVILLVWCTFGMGIFMLMDRYGRKKGILSLY
ncbi:MAG: ABC transporter permease [candidate division WOR-3 bacterium]|nr:MAG: ABC transporter permease [candidate division WOR-3 bacterium]